MHLSPSWTTFFSRGARAVRGSSILCSTALSLVLGVVLGAPALGQDQPVEEAGPQVEAGAGDESASVGAPRASEPAARELPPGVLARLDGRDITVEEYAGYLVGTLGRAKLDEYIDRLLLEQEAETLGLRLAPDNVEEILQARIRRTIDSLYQGKEELFIASLRRRRSTREEYEARWRQRTYYDLLTDAVVRKTRKVTPEALQREFTRTYGEGGVQVVLRHLLVSKRLRTASGPVRSDTEAQARAEKILAEIRGGLDFVQAVKQYTDDTFSRRNEGRLEHYRKGFFGEAFDEAVAKLTTEQPLTGVVVSPRGYHIVRLVERRTTRLEDVKDDLERFYANREPTVEEKHQLRERLRAAAEIEGL